MSLRKKLERAQERIKSLVEQNSDLKLRLRGTKRALAAVRKELRIYGV